MPGEIQSNRTVKINATIRVFKLLFCYKGLYFNVFNTTNTENRVNAKYSTKNNITDVSPVFLATKNQRRAIIISRMNLIPKATSIYIVRVSGSFFCPLKIIISIRSDRNANDKERTAIPVKSNPGSGTDDKINPPARITISIRISQEIFL
jgi:hypothetical protein